MGKFFLGVFCGILLMVGAEMLNPMIGLLPLTLIQGHHGG